MSFDAEPIDPRDSGWLEDTPAYRVYFHDRDGAADEWRITGAESVNDVMKWAQSRTDGRTYALYVEVALGTTGLVRLDGLDPNAT